MRQQLLPMYAFEPEEGDENLLQDTSDEDDDLALDGNLNVSTEEVRLGQYMFML